MRSGLPSSSRSLVKAATKFINCGFLRSSLRYAGSLQRGQAEVGFDKLKALSIHSLLLVNKLEACLLAELVIASETVGIIVYTQTKVR